MGALRSKGCRDASGTKPLNALLSYEEAGNRASLVLKAAAVWIRDRERQSADAGRSREQTPITVECVKWLTVVSLPSSPQASPLSARATSCALTLYFQAFARVECVPEHVGTPIAIWQCRPFSKGGLCGYTAKSFVQSSIRTGATAHPPERTQTKNNNKEEFTRLRAAESWKSRGVPVYF